MIPRLIHQTAKTADLPRREQMFQQALIKLHPGWKYKLWTDEDNLAFVKSEFPEFFDVFVGLPKNIMRADVIRYLLMDRLGGLYLDTDYEMLKPFDMVEHDCVLPLETAGDLNPSSRIANSVFAAAPGHPFFRRVIDRLKSNPPLDPQTDVLTSTGPHFISEVLHSMSSEEMTVFTPRCELFNPPTPIGSRRRQVIVDAGVAYGIHHCHGSWRDYSIWEKVRLHVSQLIQRLT